MSRPRNFDEQEVTTRAMLAFLEGGYETTSLAVLEVATGVDRKGLYNTFGDKEGLFIAAVNRWIETGSERHICLAEADGAAFPEIVAVFDFIVGYAQTSLGQYGCLVCNSVREPIGESPRVKPIFQAYLARVQAAFQHALTNELAGYDIPAKTIEKLAHALLGTFVAAFVLARAPVESQVLGDFVGLSVGQLETQLQALKRGGSLDFLQLHPLNPAYPHT